MPFALDESLHWTEHFIKYGFAVLRNQVPREFTDRALEKLRDHVEGEGKNLPFDQWTTQNIKVVTQGTPKDPVLDAAYDQPNIRHIIKTMYGTDKIGAPDGWSGVPEYRIFINPFNPDSRQHKLWGGHIDFGGNIIPLFGNAFVIQLCLRDTEPHGGNITVIPGSHKLVQQRAIENPLTQYPYDFENYPFTEPYEFVAKAGDVFLMHHLCFHSGNPCVGDNRRPRLALHLQAMRTTFLTKADPADASNPPWVKAFTLNGFIEDPNDQDRYTRFNAAKTAMWGYWTSDDNQTQYKIYTYQDGCLWVKSKSRAGEEVLCVDRPRFDGKRLTFEEKCEAPGNAAAASGNAVTVEATRCKTSLEIDANNLERMTARIQLEGATPRIISLKRTQTFKGRMPG